MTSRLDYCNALLGGCPASSINKLQVVQNAAARVLTRSRKYDHITPILQSLHWLPIKFCISYNILLLTYKALKGIVHPKMKISPRFTHPQGILGMSDIPLSDEHIQSYIRYCPVCSNLYNCSEWCPCFWIRKKSIHPSQNYSTRLRGVNKELLKQNDVLV